jgi:hypothetical protein
MKKIVARRVRKTLGLSTRQPPRFVGAAADPDGERVARRGSTRIERARPSTGRASRTSWDEEV